jgi:hypothetical protein
MLADPKKYLTKATLIDALTEENPGKLATRNVPARAIRAVFMMPLGYYVWETWMGAPMLNWQSDQEFFSLASEIGRFIADHKNGIWASNDKETLIVLMDFSSFDTTQKWSNMRQWLVQAWEQWCEAKGLDKDTFGPWSSVKEMMTTVWTKTAKAWFLVGMTLISTDQVNSGEYMTIVLNNMSNLANLDDILETMWLKHNDLRSAITWTYHLQGDDSESVLQKAGGWKVNEISTIRDTIESVSSSNSFELSKIKTSVRRSLYEYLKKMSIYGYIIGRLSALMILCSERNTFSEPVVEMMRSYNGLLSEYVSRGGDHQFITYLSAFTWNFKRRVKVRTPKMNELYTLPMGILWTPGELGGIDMIPWSLIGASKSSLMYQLYRGSFRDYITYCIEILDVNVNIFRQAIAAEVLDGGTFNEGLKFLKESLNPGSVVTSEIAARELTKAGIDIGQWRYTNSPVRLIKRAIADNPRLVEIVKEEKKSAVKLMKIKQSRLPGGGSWAYMWVKNPERMGWLTRYARDLRSYTLGYDTDYTWSNILGKHYIRMVSEDPGVPAIVIGSEEELHMVEGSHLAKLIIPNNIWEMSRNEFESLLSSFLPRTLRVIKDHLGLKYAWQSGLFFEYVGERLPDKHDIIPVVGLSADIQAKMKVTGISSAGDDNAIVITNLAASLIRDRQLPNDITAEKLITLLTNPAIMSDPKNITNA